MITKNIDKQAKSLVEVSVTVPWADLEPKWNEVLAKLGNDIEIPGFRKGTAPANMVETQLGSKLADEVLKVAMPEFLIQALQGSDVVPIDYPKYQLIAFTKGSDLQYKALVTNRPEIKIGEYKTIKVSKPAAKVVNEDEVTKVIDDLFKRWSTRAGQAPIAAPQPDNTQGGSISFNGQNVAATTAGSDSTTPDDNFAKAMGATDLNDLKLKVRKDLEDNTNYNSELDFEEAILQQVEKITTVELPEILIEGELNRMLVSLQRRVADMGLLMDDYLKNQGKTLEQLKTEWRPQSEKNVRMELGLSEIARLESVVVSDADLQAEIDKIQDARVKRQFEADEPRLQLRHALRQTRTLNLLKSLVT
jgi:trigger factor